MISRHLPFLLMYYDVDFASLSSLGSLLVICIKKEASPRESQPLLTYEKHRVKVTL